MITEKDLKEVIRSCHQKVHCGDRHNRGTAPRWMAERGEVVGKEVAKASGRFFRVSANVIRFRPFGKLV